MANTPPHRIVDLSNYEYEGVGGSWSGALAFVLNHLDSADASMEEEREHTGLSPEDMAVYNAVQTLLTYPANLAKYL